MPGFLSLVKLKIPIPLLLGIFHGWINSSERYEASQIVQMWKVLLKVYKIIS